MALSNIFKEPRREITESAVGIGVVFGALWADYAFAVWLQDVAGYVQYADGTRWNKIHWVFGMLLGPAVAVLAFALLWLTHEIGDGLCNALQARGIHLRPRVRRQ